MCVCRCTDWRRIEQWSTRCLSKRLCHLRHGRNRRSTDDEATDGEARLLRHPHRLLYGCRRTRPWNHAVWIDFPLENCIANSQRRGNEGANVPRWVEGARWTRTVDAGCRDLLPPFQLRSLGTSSRTSSSTFPSNIHSPVIVNRVASSRPSHRPSTTASRKSSEPTPRRPRNGDSRLRSSASSC
jgi:hypothetical protein